jgi:excisionase family DNA binding protein
MNELNNELLSDGLQRLSEAARFLGCSRSLIYKLIRMGLLPSVKIGKSRRVPIRAVRELASDHLAYETLDEPGSKPKKKPPIG